MIQTRRRPREMFLLRSREGIDDILAKLKHGVLAVDTETTGLNWREDMVGAICLAAGETAIFAMQGALKPIVHYLSDQIKAERQFVFHHAKFDMHMLRASFGLHFPYPVHDTKIMSHLIDQRGVGNWKYSNHHLKDLARRFIDPEAKDAQQKLLKSIRDAVGFPLKNAMAYWLLAKWKYYAKYGALDPWYTLQLYHFFIDTIRYWPQPDGYPSLMSLYKNEQWLILALRDMEARGIKVSEEQLVTWRDGLEREQRRTIKKLNRYAGRDNINWNSHPQVKKVLYEDLGLTTERRTKAGQLSTDKNALMRIKHPIAEQLLKYNKTTHSITAGANSVLNRMTDKNIIHCEFNQNVDTGRMSCSDPNLQGQDKKSGIRNGFKPRKNLVLRFIDYDQGEMRVAAHIANEPTLIKGFNTDPKFDTHSGTAAQMFDLRKPTDEQRGYGKTMNFAMLFGAGVGKIAEGLAARMSWREAKIACRAMGHKLRPGEDAFYVLAELLKAKYKERMPRMSEGVKEREEAAEIRSYAINLFGRHRFLSSRETYKAFNTEVQGSLADLGKRGLVAIYRDLQLNDGVIAMLLQVHDEVVYESDGDPKVDKMAKELLEDTKSFRVPITADISGSNVSWGDKKKISA